MKLINNLKINSLIKLSILFSIIIFFSINIIVNNSLSSSKMDFTENKLYSLSEGTRSLLQNLKEPIHMRLFISSNLVKEVPQLSTYANRVEAILVAYQMEGLHLKLLTLSLFLTLKTELLEWV